MAVLVQRFTPLLCFLPTLTPVYLAVVTVHGGVAVDALGYVSVHVAHGRCVVGCYIGIGVGWEGS